MLIWPVRFLAQRLFLRIITLSAQTAAPLSMLETKLEWTVTTADLLSIIAANHR